MWPIKQIQFSTTLAPRGIDPKQKIQQTYLGAFRFEGIVQARRLAAMEMVIIGN